MHDWLAECGFSWLLVTELSPKPARFVRPFFWWILFMILPPFHFKQRGTRSWTSISGSSFWSWKEKVSLWRATFSFFSLLAVQARPKNPGSEFGSDRGEYKGTQWSEVCYEENLKEMLIMNSSIHHASWIGADFFEVVTTHKPGSWKLQLTFREVCVQSGLRPLSHTYEGQSVAYTGAEVIATTGRAGHKTWMIK